MCLPFDARGDFLSDCTIVKDIEVSASPIQSLSQAQIEAWNDLLERSSARTAFLSHDFCSTVASVRGRVRVIRIREAGGRAGFLPVQLLDRPAWLGHSGNVAQGMSDFFGIVGDLESHIDASSLLRGANLTSIRFDHALPLPFSFHDGEPQEGLRLRVTDFAAFKENLQRTNKVFASSVYSRERGLQREYGALRFSWKAADPASALNWLISMKRAQYGSTGVRDSLAQAWRRKLLASLLQKPATRQCEAILSTLHAGNDCVAAKISLICFDTLHSWFSVYDRRFRKFGPGHILWFKVIEEATARGVSIFDFGEGISDYKLEYGGERYPLWKGGVRLNSARGQSDRLIQSVSWRANALLDNMRRRVRPEARVPPASD